MIFRCILQPQHSFLNKRRIFITHNSDYLPFAPKRPTIHGRINRSTLPYPMETKKREAKRSHTEEFRDLPPFGMPSGCVRDASKGLSSRVNQVVPFLSFSSCSLTILQSHVLQCPSEMVILCQQQYVVIQLKRIEHTQIDPDGDRRQSLLHFA